MWLREKAKQSNDSPRTQTRKLHVLKIFSKPCVKRTLFLRNLVIEQVKGKVQRRKEGKKNIVAAVLLQNSLLLMFVLYVPG